MYQYVLLRTDIFLSVGTIEPPFSPHLPPPSGSYLPPRLCWPSRLGSCRWRWASPCRYMHRTAPSPSHCCPRTHGLTSGDGRWLNGGVAVACKLQMAWRSGRYFVMPAPTKTVAVTSHFTPTYTAPYRGQGDLGGGGGGPINGGGRLNYTKCEILKIFFPNN